MEKIIELYYEYKLDLLKREMRVNGATEREIEIADTEKVEEEELEKDLNKLSELKLFVKRLVDNNKINKRKIDTRLVRYVENHYDEEGYWVESSYENYSDTNTLLMLLSISYTPIEDLISYLK